MNNDRICKTVYFPCVSSHLSPSSLKGEERIKNIEEGKKKVGPCSKNTKKEREREKGRACWRASLSFGHWSVPTSNLLSSLRSPVSTVVTSLFTHPKTSKPSGDFLGGFNIKISGDETEQKAAWCILVLIRPWVEEGGWGRNRTTEMHVKVWMQTHTRARARTRNLDHWDSTSLLSQAFGIANRPWISE